MANLRILKHIGRICPSKPNWVVAAELQIFSMTWLMWKKKENKWNYEGFNNLENRWNVSASENSHPITTNVDWLENIAYFLPFSLNFLSSFHLSLGNEITCLFFHETESNEMHQWVCFDQLITTPIRHGWFTLPWEGIPFVQLYTTNYKHNSELLSLYNMVDQVTISIVSVVISV